MNQNHTNEPNYTKLVMPRQLVLPLDYGILIKETAPFLLASLRLAKPTRAVSGQGCTSILYG